MNINHESTQKTKMLFMTMEIFFCSLFSHWQSFKFDSNDPCSFFIVIWKCYTLQIVIGNFNKIVEILKYVPCILWTIFSSIFSISPKLAFTRLHVATSKHIGIFAFEFQSNKNTHCDLFASLIDIENISLETRDFLWYIEWLNAQNKYIFWLIQFNLISNEN